MAEPHYLTLSIVFGENKKVASVTSDGKIIFVNVPLALVLSYLENLRYHGWKVVKVNPTESGEIYILKFEGP